MSTTKINAAKVAANVSDNTVDNDAAKVAKELEAKELEAKELEAKERAAKVAKVSPTLVESLATGQNKITTFDWDNKGNLTVSFESPVKFGGQGANKPLLAAIFAELASNHLTLDKARSSQISWYLAHDASAKVSKSRASSSDELDSRVAFMLSGAASYLIGKGLTSPVDGECRKNGSDWEPIKANEPLAWTAFRFGLADGIRESDHVTKVPVDLDAAKDAILDALLATMDIEALSTVYDHITEQLDAAKELEEEANQTA